MRTRAPAAGAQQTRARCPAARPGGRGRAALEPVIAGAEKREVIVRKPLEESAGLDLLAARERGHAGQHRCAICRARSRICGQSATATRTSSSYSGSGPHRFEPCRVARRATPRCAARTPRCRHRQPDPRRRSCVRARPAARAAPGAPSGGSTRPLSFSTMVSESTRNGMSSVTTSTTVRGDDQPSRPRADCTPGRSDRRPVAPGRARGGDRRGSGEVRRLPLQVVLVDAAIVRDEVDERFRRHGPGDLARAFRDRVDQMLPRRRNRSCHRVGPWLFRCAPLRACFDRGSAPRRRGGSGPPRSVRGVSARCVRTPRRATGRHDPSARWRRAATARTRARAARSCHTPPRRRPKPAAPIDGGHPWRRHGATGRT